MSVYLFVPADRPERYAKAQITGARVIIDLEDAVSFGQKDDGRANVLAFDRKIADEFANRQVMDRDTYWLRINGCGRYLEQDLALLGELQCVQGVFLPKCQDVTVLEAVVAQTSLPIVPMIESVQGWQCLTQIARARGVCALSYGALDLANALHLQRDTAGAGQIFDHLRAELVLASAMAGIGQPLECVFARFDDNERFYGHVYHAHSMGFGGQLCIHPCQVAIALGVYAPDAKLRAFAMQVIAHHKKTGEFAFAIDGQMVDLPVIEWARDLVGE